MSDKTPDAIKPWGGRFSEATDAFVERFTASVTFDKRLYHHDINGSIAHATMLAKVGVLTDAERDSIIAGLAQIQGEQGREVRRLVAECYARLRFGAWSEDFAAAPVEVLDQLIIDFAIIGEAVAQAYWAES